MTYVKNYDIKYSPDTTDSYTDGDKRCELFDNITSSHGDADEEESERQRAFAKPLKYDAVALTQGAHLHDMLHEEDPKELILKKLGDISGLNIYGARVLVATYIRPERKKSGLILTSSVREEDKFQGKCGLVIKLGPLAFKDTEKLDFTDSRANLGDWVVYRPMDGVAQSVNGVHCRLLDDIEINGDVNHPDLLL